MYKLKKILKNIFPVVLILVVIGAIYIFETKIKYNLVTTDIVVAKENIPFMSPITQDNTKIERVYTENIHSDSVTDLASLIGKYAKVDIPKDMQLGHTLVTDYNLLIKEDEFVSPIANQWIFAVTGTLKKGMLVDFYLVKESEFNFNLDSSSQNIITINEPILENIKVSSVRDSSNQEVDADAVIGNSVVHSLEVIFNKEQLEIVKKYMEKDQYKLYITQKK